MRLQLLAEASAHVKVHSVRRHPAIRKDTEGALRGGRDTCLRKTRWNSVWRAAPVGITINQS
jgi:hypothetical protein